MSRPASQHKPAPLAFMNESELDPRTAPHTYVLAVTLVAATELEPIPQAMLALRAPGQRKLHWHTESARRRSAIVDRIASLPIRHVAVVRDGLPGEQPERRRRKCLAGWHGSWTSAA